jgi:presequence protease
MKGHYSNAGSLLNKATRRSLFADNAYCFDSFGDPAAIPDLTFGQLKAFHKRHYHPSNSRIYFAGDDDVDKRLELMNEYLKGFDASDHYKEQSKILWQTKFNVPKREVLSFPAGANQPPTHMFAMSWLLNDRRLTPVEDVTLVVLDHLLMGTTSSILRKTLIESGLGSALTGVGLFDQLLQATYSVGLEGVQPDKVHEGEQLILDTLAMVLEEGFATDDIESSLNTVEFMLRGNFP